MRIVIVLMLVVSPALAQTDSLVVRVGEPVEEIVSGTDAAMRYAVYLPTAYERGMPVLFLMDPRGRAMVPLALFREAAERHGYVVMSSYNTLSDADSAFAVNARALSAMIVDAQVRFGVDPARFYLVGFSGTAHYAWTAAAQLDGHVAGIVAVGGGLPIYSPSVQAALHVTRPFAYFAMAGRADFNYDAVRLLDRSLDTTRVAHRMAAFEGPHSWMPQELASEAVDWLELRAMQTGPMRRDEEWMEAACRGEMAEAREMEGREEGEERREEGEVGRHERRRGIGGTEAQVGAEGSRGAGGLDGVAGLSAAARRAEAARRYREIAVDCSGFESAGTAAARRDELAGSRDVRRVERRRDELAREVFEYKVAVRDFAEGYRGKMVPHRRALRRLDVKRLRARADVGASDRGASDGGATQGGASDGGHSDEANAARRMLASAFATTAFYEPRAYVEGGDYERAAGMLRLALEIRPDVPFACLWLARAEAQLGRIEEGLDALECAVEGGAAGAAELTADRGLAPLAGSERWNALVKTVSQKSDN